MTTKQQEIYIIQIEYWNDNSLLSVLVSLDCYPTYGMALDVLKRKSDIKQITPWRFRDSRGVVYRIEILRLMED